VFPNQHLAGRVGVYDWETAFAKIVVVVAFFF